MNYENAGKPFAVLHLADEFGSDPVDWVDLTFCKAVVRIYNRPDLARHPKVITIPLGPYRRSPPHRGLENRSIVWSFFGTRWQDREAALLPLTRIGPSNVKFFDTWMDAQQLTPSDYSRACLASIFMPCPRGQNPETFRIYEALEHGSVPILQRETGDEDFYKMLTAHLNILIVDKWEHAVGLMKHLLDPPQNFIEYYRKLQEQWLIWKRQISEDVRKHLALGPS